MTFKLFWNKYERIQQSFDAHDKCQFYLEFTWTYSDQFTYINVICSTQASEIRSKSFLDRMLLKIQHFILALFPLFCVTYNIQVRTLTANIHLKTIQSHISTIDMQRDLDKFQICLFRVFVPHWHIQSTIYSIMNLII